MTAQKIRLGTRGSQLAMWQSTWIAQQLEAQGIEVQLIKIQTEGDVQTGPLAQIGRQGLALLALFVIPVHIYHFKGA